MPIGKRQYRYKPKGVEMVHKSLLSSSNSNVEVVLHGYVEFTEEGIARSTGEIILYAWDGVDISSKGLVESPKVRYPTDGAETLGAALRL
jgi:hypothetical protein